MGVPKNSFIILRKVTTIHLLKYSIVPSWAFRGSGFSSLCAFSSPLKNVNIKNRDAGFLRISHLHVLDSQAKVHQVEVLRIVSVREQVRRLHIVVRVAFAVDIFQAVQDLQGERDDQIQDIFLQGSTWIAMLAIVGRESGFSPPLKVLSRSAPSLSMTMNLRFVFASLEHPEYDTFIWLSHFCRHTYPQLP